MKLKYTNTASYVHDHTHGYHVKDLAVLHETVSFDAKGLGDILNIEAYLAQKDYGIHGMTDFEGNIAWALGEGRAIFWQAGGVNERSIGIEQVSRVMLEAPDNATRAYLWSLRQAELRATAKLLAAAHRVQGIPLVYSNGLVPGITTHWDVSQHFAASEGHTDCWPKHKGGYYPVMQVIYMARAYNTVPGYTF